MGKPRRGERNAVDQAHGNGRILPSAVFQHNGAVFAVQIHRERPVAGNTVYRMLTGTAGKRAFIHHDDGFVLCRLHRYVGRTEIPGNRNRQLAVRRVSVRIKTAVIENQTRESILRHIIVRIQGKGVAAVLSKRQRPHLLVAAHHLVAVQRILAVGHSSPFHMIKTVSTETVVVGNIAAGRNLRSFRHVVGIRCHHRHIVHDVHRNGAFCHGIVGIRHRHADGMTDIVGIVVFGAVLQRVVAQRIGITQPAICIAGAERAFFMHVQSHCRAVQGHFHALGSKREHDALHAVGSRNVQRAFGRGGNSGLTGLRAAFKAGFVHRYLVGGRRHGNAVVHAVDGDGHGTRGNVAVRVRVGVGKLFRQLFVLGKSLHFGVVIIERVAVCAVGFQSDCAVLALLLRIRPCKVCSVSSGRRTFQSIAVDGRGIPFRHIVHETFNGRNVVGNDHGYNAGTRGAVVIRHGNGKVVSYLVRALTAVFLRGLRKMVGVVQTPGGIIEPRHFQIAFIRGHGLPRKTGAVKHHDAADDDGRNAVWRINHHVAGSRDGRAAAKTGFVHIEHVAFCGWIGISVVRVIGVVYDRNVVIQITGVAGRNAHRVIDITVAVSRTVRVGIDVATGPADIETAQTVEAVKKIGRHIIMKAVAVALRSCGPTGTGGRHEVRLIHGHKEVFTRDFRALHLEYGHVVLGERRIEIFKQNSTAVFKGHDHVVSGAGQRGGVGGKIENEATLRFANYGLGHAGGRLHKAYIGHDNLLRQKRKKEVKEKKCLTRKSPATAQTPERGLIQASKQGGKKGANAAETRAKDIKKSCNFHRFTHATKISSSEFQEAQELFSQP